MDLKITKKQDNPLLSRLELEAKISFLNEPTPKKEDVKKMICAAEKADEKVVVVRKICGDFGVGRARVLAYVYNSEDDLKRIEPKEKEKKDAKKEASKEGEAPKKEAKEE